MLAQLTNGGFGNGSHHKQAQAAQWAAQANRLADDNGHNAGAGIHSIRNDHESHQRHNDGHGCAAIHKRAQQQHAQQHRTALAVRCCPAILFPSYPYHTIQLTLFYAKCDGLFIVKRNKTSAIILPDLIFFINWQVCQTSFGQIVQHDLAFLWNFIKFMDLLIFHIFRFPVEFFSNRKPWACPALLPAHIGKARSGRDLLNLFIKI